MASLNLKNMAVAAGLALTAATAMTMSGFSTPAMAQQAKVASGENTCVADPTKFGSDVDCKFKALRESEARGRELDKENAALDKLNACLRTLKAAKQGGAVFGVKITEQNACDIAAKYGQRAGGPAGPVQ